MDDGEDKELCITVGFAHTQYVSYVYRNYMMFTQNHI